MIDITSVVWLRRKYLRRERIGCRRGGGRTMRRRTL